MGGVQISSRFLASAWVAVCVLLAAPSVQAIEAGPLQIHGFYENQTRVISRNFDGTDDFDLTQWYQVLNLEMELDIAPDGWGPFDIISAYARVEARFDCVYDRACYVFPSANAFGDRAKKLPKRYSDGRRSGFTGSQFTGHVRKRHGISRDILPTKFGIPAPTTPANLAAGLEQPGLFPGGRRKPASIFNVPGIDTLFGQEGANSILGDFDDPAPFVLSRFDDYKFGLRKVRGSVNGNGTQTLGPWLPKNFVDGTGALRDKPNPFRSGDLNPILPQVTYGDLLPGGPNPSSQLISRGNFLDDEVGFQRGQVAPCSEFNTPQRADGGGPAAPVDPARDQWNSSKCFGTAALPYRPAPIVGPNGAEQQFAQGIYYPNFALAQQIADDNFDNFDQNFRESELKWNRGASQQQTHFLKEAYVDIELFDSSLWLRLGKQSIVMGKTELFRTTDQFNPQDLALSTLPSLEESRISLWAARAVWSLWQVGPLEDVRLEVAANIDTYQGADLGQCGEPYTPNPACNIRAGLFAHGISGFGLAGLTRPPAPWEDIKGLEFGARMEFRYGAFSFALTNFYGYDDFPFADQLFRYERNVDPFTGRPRERNQRGQCTTGTEADCLLASEALTKHSVNQQLFAFICSTSIAFAADLDPTVCAQSIFNSQNRLLATITPAQAISLALGGDQIGLGTGSAVLALLLPGTTCPGPDPFGYCPNITAQNIPIVDLDVAVGNSNGLDNLTPQQQALIGCGPFYGTACQADGLDLLNAEASAISSAWITQPNAPSTTLGAGQPGTIPYAAANGRFWCQRFVQGSGLVVLPGCKAGSAAEGAVEAGWQLAVDGDRQIPTHTENRGGLPAATIFNCPIAGDVGFCNGHPFTGEGWYSYMDAFSWNFQMLLVVFSLIGANNDVVDPPGTAVLNPDEFDVTEFNPRAPLAADRCSWAAPQFCSNVSAFLSIIGQRRNSALAGGNSRFGRSDFVWHGGTSNRLKHQKRNVLGFSMDFAEDITKTNWSVESTWFHNVIVADNDALDGVKEVDFFNMTVSVDRPTFINFLNQNRTFFINSQWFFQYTEGFEQSMPRNGPFNVLATLTVFSGFYQDRLNPSLTVIYDFMSESGGILPSISYRFSESFSVEFGMALFYGKWQSTRMPINPISLGNNTGSGAYRDFSERGLGVVRDRDEAFVRLRKTF